MRIIKGKRIGIIFIMVLMLFLSGNVAEAKSSKVKVLKPGKVYSYDLNGDKKKEKIVCKTILLYDHDVHWRIYIDDKLAYSKNYVHWGADFCLADFNTKDKFKEIVVNEGIVNQGYDYTVCFRYKDGELQDYFSFPPNKVLECYWLSKKQPGNGKICFWSDTPFYEVNLGKYLVKVEYKVSKGKFKKITGNTYTVVGDCMGDELSYELARNVNMRYGLKDSRTKCTLKKGTQFSLEKINVSNNRIKYIYIKTSTGTKGWIRFPKGKFVKEIHGWS